MPLTSSDTYVYYGSIPKLLGASMHYGVISADNHLIEPPHTFTDYLPAKYKDRAPRILAGPGGGEGWSFDGRPPAKTFGLDAAASKDYKLDSKDGLAFSEI